MRSVSAGFRRHLADKTPMNVRCTLMSTQLHDAFIGHERQRHDLIGCRETRSVNAQRVLDTCIPMRGLFTLEFVRELEFRSCVVNEPLECRPPSRPESVAICTAHFTSSSLSPRKRGIMFLPALVWLSVCLPVCLSVCLLPR